MSEGIESADLVFMMLVALIVVASLYGKWKDGR